MTGVPNEPWLPAESNRLQPDHHPTPFSAAQIRDGFVVGREVRSLTVRAGAEPYVHVRRNVSADDDAGVFEVWTETLEGDRTSEPEQGSSTFLELQHHASMPVAATAIEPVEIDVPMGCFDGLRYTRVLGDKVDTFWFALARPGAPVRIEFRVAGTVVFSSTAISERHPSS
jgi:hypothetical protein